MVQEIFFKLQESQQSSKFRSASDHGFQNCAPSYGTKSSESHFVRVSGVLSISQSSMIWLFFTSAKRSEEIISEVYSCRCRIQHVWKRKYIPPQSMVQYSRISERQSFPNYIPTFQYIENNVYVHCPCNLICLLSGCTYSMSWAGIARSTTSLNSEFSFF